MKKTYKYEQVLDVPEDLLGEYHEAFEMFDVNKRGEISVEEISRIMKNYGNPLPKNDIRNMIREIDRNGDEALDFEEFVTLMKKRTIWIEENPDEEILRAFRFFDKDKSGYITLEEFRQILTQIGEKMSDRDIEVLFDICDLNKDTKLNYQEFINFWKRNEQRNYQ